MSVARFTVIDAVTGQIKRSGECPDILYQYQCGDGELILPERFRDDLHYYDVQAGLIMDIPPAPSASHRWNPVTRSWDESRTCECVRSAHVQAIEIEREARINAPILMDAVLVDADEKSQRNITNKLSEIHDLQILDLPGLTIEECVWRLADDSMLTFASETDYRTWLTQLAIAIRKRGTQAYMWSWSKKSQLQALGDDLQALQDFDPVSD